MCAEGASAVVDRPEQPVLLPVWHFSPRYWTPLDEPSSKAEQPDAGDTSGLRALGFTPWHPGPIADGSAFEARLTVAYYRRESPPPRVLVYVQRGTDGLQVYTDTEDDARALIKSGPAFPLWLMRHDPEVLEFRRKALARRDEQSEVARRAQWRAALGLDVVGIDFWREWGASNLVISVEEAAAAALMVKGLGSFLDAYAKTLGEKLGESTAAAAGRLRTHLLGRRAGAISPVKDDTGVTVLLVAADLTEEARLALIDLDVTDPTLSGAMLRWDAEGAQWRPAPPGTPTSGVQAG
jgi:hypothetical protein